MKIKATRPGFESDKIKPTQIDLNKRISFSFKYLKENRKFNYSYEEIKYFHKIFERFKSLSDWNPQSLKSNRSRSLRCHPIFWNDKNITENCFGIPKEAEIVDEPYQFEISQNRYGRVHGFFIGPVFYIVWFDPEHNLCK